MKKTFREYHIDDKALHEWLPWGGLIHPAVVRNKDESLMGFLRYNGPDDIVIDFSDNGTPLRFVNGWTLWTERQHFHNTGTETIFTIVWNPFFNREDFAVNTLNGKKVNRRELELYFFTVLETMQKSISSKMSVKILENEEALSYLASTISMRKEQIPLPDITLYLDAMLSMDIKFKMLTSQIRINDQYIAIVSIPALAQYSSFIINVLFQHLQQYEYRFCRRALIFSEKSAQGELSRYTQSWCKNRSTIKDCIKKDLLQAINGYYSNVFVFFHEHEEKLQQNVRQVEAILETIGLPYVIEDKNYKDIWWSCLPGIFRANVTPPIQSVPNIRNFLLPCVKENTLCTN